MDDFILFLSLKKIGEIRKMELDRGKEKFHLILKIILERGRMILFKRKFVFARNAKPKSGERDI